MLSYIIPTRNRPLRLKQTLNALESLGSHNHLGGAEVIVIDNASDEFPILPPRLTSGLPIRFIRRRENLGAAARNIGAAAADRASRWLVMLDDDSYPINLDFAASLVSQPATVGAVMADIFVEKPADSSGQSHFIDASLGHLSTILHPTNSVLATHQSLKRESGGLPEVFIGCGVAIRRDAFLALGGYDPSFNYYAEEYDLAAKLLLAGFRTVFDRSFIVHHAKDTTNRDMNLILSRLVRNNGWVAQRYAPPEKRLHELREIRRRYRQIAMTENAIVGYAEGLSALRHTLRAQVRQPLSRPLFDRFTGLAAARTALQSAFAASPFRSATIVDAGKNSWAVAKALQDMGIRITTENDHAEAAVIGTLSPGPMLDSLRKRAAFHRGRGCRLIAPWLEAQRHEPANRQLLVRAA